MKEEEYKIRKYVSIYTQTIIYIKHQTKQWLRISENIFSRQFIGKHIEKTICLPVNNNIIFIIIN